MAALPVRPWRNGGTVESKDVDAWIQGYVAAWNSNDPEAIGGLFTDDARYYTAPHREPWSGREGIVSGWLERKDEPGSFDFRHEVTAVCDGVAFVRGWTAYRDPPLRYSNLWVIRLNEDGRCSEFTEWWMEESG